MIEMITFMATPFAACLLLLAMSGYLGLHVLNREIIFIDISLAQIATLGTTAAFMLRLNPHSSLAYFLSLGAIAAAAWVFAVTRFACRRIPQEAVIGITYAVATMAAVILIDQAAGGHEHIREMLAGSILWVKWSEVAAGGLVYALVGLFHWCFRKKFSLLTSDYEQAVKSGMSVKLWDFLFYFSFGLVMVHAVRIGGVLLVFAFLVIPSTVSAILANTWKARIIIAWVIGGLVSIAGLMLSWSMDLLSGPIIVCLLGLVLLAVGFWRKGKTAAMFENASG